MNEFGETALDHDPDPTIAATDRRFVSLIVEASGRARFVLSSIVVAVLGYVIVQPDWYHIQNALDPFFYTGMSLNLSDSIDQGAQAHYFLGRWTLYLPEMVFERMLGAEHGFILFRIAILAVVAFCVMYVGGRHRRLVDGVVVAMVLVFSPLILRAVFVDYTDVVVVSAGIAAIVVALFVESSPWYSALLGVLLAAMCISNVFSVVLVLLIVIVRSLHLRSARDRLADLSVIALSGLTMVLAGWVFFRMRYGIANVYSPTVDFVRRASSLPDHLKSPRHLWLQYRLWIYLPPIVLVVALALRRWKKVRFGRAEQLVFALCAADYAFQVFYQFVRNGDTLEIHYYFTYAIPPLIAAAAIVLYELVGRCSTREVLLLLAGVLLLWLNDGFPGRFGSWLIATVAVAFAAAIGWLSWDKLRVLPALLFAAVFLSLQLEYPANEPILPGEQRVESGYDLAWTRRDSIGRDTFHQTLWFMAQMDRLGNPVEQRTGFVLGGGLSYQLAATYSVEVAQPSHWLNQSGPPADFGLSENSLRILHAQSLQYVAVICAPDEIPRILELLATNGIRQGTVLLDETSTTGVVTSKLYVFQVHT